MIEFGPGPKIIKFEYVSLSQIHVLHPKKAFLLNHILYVLQLNLINIIELCLDPIVQQRSQNVLTLLSLSNKNYQCSQFNTNIMRTYFSNKREVFILRIVRKIL